MGSVVCPLVPAGSPAGELPQHVGSGEPAEPAARPLPPRQDRVRQTQFGGPFRQCPVGGLADNRQGQGPGHRQVEPEYRILEVNHGSHRAAGPSLVQRTPQSVRRGRIGWMVGPRYIRTHGASLACCHKPIVHVGGERNLN